MPIEFYKHNLGTEEKESIANALDSFFLTTGKRVLDFEHQFSDYLGIPYTVGVNSCTAALHLSLLALGIGPGDEVITTPMTFVATTLAILHVGATPIWVDVERSTGNIDANKIEEKITNKTRAIIPVHLYGNLCDMQKIKGIADKYKLAVIEDAAHCVEGARDGVRVGELGDACCFSFYATKSITCGEGGAVSVHDAALDKKIRSLRTHGMSVDAVDRYKTYKHWDLIAEGWKYNMPDVSAALLLPQISKIDAFWSKRKDVFDQYYAQLKNDFEIIAPIQKSGYHLFTVLCENRDNVLKFLQDKGIGCAVNYRSINTLSYMLAKFNLGYGSFPNSEYIGDRTLTLPLYPKLTEEEITYVCSVLLASKNA